MNGARSKVSKACEPCRRRKMRCSGTLPYCQRCQDSTECIYRLKPRIRGRNPRRTPLSEEPNSNGITNPRNATTAPNSQHMDLYHGVAATNHTPHTAQNSQLFYGPSSNFAFLQQIHRNILASPHGPRLASDVQEGGPGLDMFMQRSFFFGTPSYDIASCTDTASSFAPPVNILEAKHFLEQFKGTHLAIMALLSSSAIDELFLCVYGETLGTSLNPKRALCFAMLAIGALSTPLTSSAEVLYHHAKKEAVAHEEYVSLPMIQLSILLADYQLNIGRPNAAYLHLGTACRKSFALGLHQDTCGALSNIDAEERCNTLWCLYFFEVWLGLTLGRKNTMRRSDIVIHSFPENQVVLAALSRLAVVAEEAIDLLYLQRAASLRHLHATAEKLYATLCSWGNKYGVDSASTKDDQTMPLAPVASLFLHSVYFHTVLLVFRPFLIAESALAVDGTLHLSSELWLRQACRRATDTAQDAIFFMNNIFGQSEDCRHRRFGSFFLETWCSVLFYDSLRRPAKHPHNMEYVRMALRCLESMVTGEPVSTTIRSIRRIQQAVEQSISGLETNTSRQENSNRTASLRGPLDQNLSSVQFPSLDPNVTGPANDLIFFTERANAFDIASHSSHTDLELSVGLSTNSTWVSDFNVLATDLFNFFPIIEE